MVSIRGKIAIAYIRKNFNMNPEVTLDPITRCRLLERHNAVETSQGYTLDRRTLEDGTRFEVVTREGKLPGGKLVLYLHGGAYIAGLTKLYRKMAGAFSHAADENGDADVIYLDYDCAPERVFPTQLDQALALWDHIVGELGYREENIVVGGDSAGGNLTLALLLKLRDAGRTMPKAAFCMSPWADMTAEGKSYTDNYTLDPLFGLKGGKIDDSKRAELLKCDIYCFIGDADRRDPYVSPVFGNYEGFPNMFLSAGTHEMLLSDTLTIAEKLTAAGNAPELVLGEGMFHVYPVYYMLFPEAKRDFKKLLAFISRNLREDTSAEK